MEGELPNPEAFNAAVGWNGAERGSRGVQDFPKDFSGFRIRDLPRTAASLLKTEVFCQLGQGRLREKNSSVSPTASSCEPVGHVRVRSPSDEAVSSFVADVCGLDDGVCSYKGRRSRVLSRGGLYRDSQGENSVASVARILCSEKNNAGADRPSSSLCNDRMRCPQSAGTQKTKFGAALPMNQLKGKRKVVDFYDRPMSNKRYLDNQDCDSNSLMKLNAGGARSRKNKRVKCPIMEELIQNRILKVGDRVEYRSDKDECLAQGWIRASGIVCGKCGQHVTCSDFGCCAGKSRGAAGENICFPSGKKLADILQQFLTIQCALSVQLAPSNSVKDVQENTDSHKDGDLDYDKTIDFLFGHT